MLADVLNIDFKESGLYFDYNKYGHLRINYKNGSYIPRNKMVKRLQNKDYYDFVLTQILLGHINIKYGKKFNISKETIKNYKTANRNLKKIQNCIKKTQDYNKLCQQIQDIMGRPVKSISSKNSALLIELDNGMVSINTPVIN